VLYLAEPRCYGRVIYSCLRIVSVDRGAVLTIRPVKEAKMKTHKQLHRLVILTLSIGLAFLLLIAQLVFSQAGPTREGFGPSRSPSSLYQEQTRPLQTERNTLSSPLNKDAAASEGWQSYPLFGGEMTSIAADPVYSQTVYVGTRDAGVFKTIDGGQTWLPARTGLTFYPIRSLEVDPQNRNVLYAGTDFDGIWKSTDGGGTWFKSSNGLYEGLIVFSIIIDPQDTDTLYVGLGGGVALGIGNIYKSENGGATWELKDNGIPRSSETSTYTSAVFTMAIDPDNPALLYAGTNTDGIFKSADGGGIWTAINKGVPFLTNSEHHKTVNALAVDPHHSNRASAVIGGKYYVFDEANGWEMGQQDHALLGMMRSYLYFHPTDPAIIYNAGGLSGFAKSSDGGVNWDDDFKSGVFSIAFHSSSPDTLYGAHRGGYDNIGGVYKSNDQGETWAEASQGIMAQAVQSVAVDPQNTDNIYVGTGSATRGYFFYTQDGGATWEKGHWHAQVLYSFSEIKDVAVDPLNSQNIYLAAPRGLFKSTDQGNFFEEIDQVLAPNCIALTADAFYVGAGHAIYKSLDGGLTWEQKTEGLPLFGGHIVPILSITVDPNDSDTVWVGTQYGGGILKSSDGDDQWHTMGLTETNFVHAIAINPDNSDEILAGGGFWDGSIYKSTDGGDTWQEKISDFAFVQDIAYDPRDSRWVYAATEWGGVLRSFDGGESWHDYSAGIFYPNLYSLDITGDDPPLLVAGSYGSGLYWIRPPAPKNIYLPLVTSHIGGNN